MAHDLGFLQGWRTLKSWALHPIPVDTWAVRKTAGGREGPKTQGPSSHTHSPFPFLNHRDTKAPLATTTLPNSLPQLFPHPGKPRYLLCPETS